MAKQRAYLARSRGDNELALFLTRPHLMDGKVWGDNSSTTFGYSVPDGYFKQVTFENSPFEVEIEVAQNSFVFLPL